MTTDSAAVRAAANRGIAATQSQDRVQATLHFESALNAAEAIGDERTRRSEISVLATLFMSMGFTDLALEAAQQAVELDRNLRLEKELTGDLLSLGNAHTNLENETKAEAAYREALSIAVGNGLWADAASASTNLAGMIANRREFGEAVKLLKASLEYLTRESFNETEVNTRVALLQVLELDAGDVDEAIENAEALCGPLWNEIPSHARRVVQDFVGQLIERYSKTHPEARSKTWQAGHFPHIQRTR